MSNINLEALEKWASRATEDQLLVAQARATAKVSLYEHILHKIINKRLEYLESITPENCTIRAKRLEIEPPHASD